MKQNLEAYRHADTMGKSPVDLILMVYDGAIKAMKSAADCYKRKENQAGYEEIQNAKRMVTHLFTTLDNDKGGQVSAHLGKMYTWVISQLLILEATKNIDQLGKVIEVMGNLRSGWETLKSQSSTIVEQTGPETSEKITEHLVVTA
jgi:flagellar secretion chaperone FliS